MSPETNPDESVEQNTSEVLLALAALSSDAQTRRPAYVESVNAMRKLADRLQNVELKITGKARTYVDPGPLSPGGYAIDSRPEIRAEGLHVKIWLANIVDEDSNSPTPNLPYVHIVGKTVDTDEFIAADLGIGEDFAQVEAV